MKLLLIWAFMAASFSWTTVYSNTPSIPIPPPAISALALALALGPNFDWSMPATACLPTNETIQQDLYQATSRFVRFKEGKSGRIILRCGVTLGDISAIRQLKLTWADTDGLLFDETEGHVVGQLKRINSYTGNVGVVRSIAIGSSSYPTGTPDVFTGLSVQSPHTMDFSKYYYYVEISIRRPPGSELNPRVYGVKLR